MKQTGRQFAGICILSALLFWLLFPAAGLGTHPVGGEQPAGYIALTFDDGPSGALTTQLLDGLAERDVHCTFFLCGYRSEEYPELVERIAEDGHEIGLHGYSHSYLDCLTGQALQAEVEDEAILLGEIAGICPTLLRPPGGRMNDEVSQLAADEHLSVILWSVDPLDWATHDSSAVCRRLLNQAGDGDILLMHDLYQSSVDAAMTVIDTLQSQGYVFVTVSELATLRGQPLLPGQTYESFPPPEP